MLVVKEIAAFFGVASGDSRHALEGPKFLKRSAGQKKDAKAR
jgi:hypothetical protein